MDNGSGKKKVLVWAPAPSASARASSSTHCSVHLWAFRRMGCETIIINNNPETVSTDFGRGDKLYLSR